MRKYFNRPLLLLAAFLLFDAHASFAWNDFGHMTVAAIAYDHLTPESKARVSTLLKLNPNYSDWVTGISDDTKDEVAFMKAAMWPDFIKRTKGYSNDGEDPKGTKASQNVGYGDKLMHRYWHYIDLPFSPDNTPLTQPKVPNAQTQIAVLRKILADKHASNELKSYDLVWLLHLVGDVHQPLHATSRFTSADPNGDRGGNDVTLCVKPCRNELHAAWDSILGTLHDPQKIMKYSRKLPSPSQTKASTSDESKWIHESFEAAKKSVYVDPVGEKIGPYELTKEYRANARKVARERVELAGVRLANLINDELK